MSIPDSDGRVLLSKKCEAALKKLLTVQWCEFFDYLAFKKVPRQSSADSVRVLKPKTDAIKTKNSDDAAVSIAFAASSPVLTITRRCIQRLLPKASSKPCRGCRSEVACRFPAQQKPCPVRSRLLYVT